MRRWIASLLSTAMLLSLAGCGGSAENVQQTTKDNTSTEIVSEPELLNTELAGFWEMIRIDSETAGADISEENLTLAKAAGTAFYLELSVDGTGAFQMGEEMMLVWDNNSMIFDNGIAASYHLEDDLMILDMGNIKPVLRKGEKPEPVIPDMEKAGFTEFMKKWVTYPYTTICTEDESKRTAGEATVIAYDVFESDTDYPARDGYEWRIVAIEVRFFDENAQAYGANPFFCYENYYNVKLYDDSIVELDESDMWYACTGTCVYFGQEMEIYARISDSWGDWRKDTNGNYETYYNIKFAFQVPAGYDGVVVGLASELNDTYITDGDPDAFLLFRMD